MADVVYLTKERLEELSSELHDLKTRGRADMAKMIADARSHGDLSENADYDAAKDAQGLMELRISKLDAILSRARVVEAGDFPNDKVYILSKVQIKNRKSGRIINYTLVSEEEADIEKNKIAVNSPIGRALMGKTIGEIVQSKAPAGVVEFEILDIQR